MRNKVVRLSAVAFMLMLFTCVCATFVGAEGDAAVADGGYYTISYKTDKRYLSVSSEGVFSFDGEIGGNSLFKIESVRQGAYILRPLSLDVDAYLSSERNELGMYLCEDDESDTVRFDISVRDGVYALSVGSLGMTVTETEQGRVLDFSGESAEWIVREYKPESMSLSLASLTTRPYTTYTDLRAVISPSYLANYIEWNSTDRSVAIVDDDGLFCALAEGEAVISASFGAYTLKCEVKVTEEASYAWYSQNNVSTGGWNGDALTSLRFSSGGVSKRFALNNSGKYSDWLSEGCAICSIAQVLNNMGARYEKGYDLRSGIDGNILADPYTVALANVGHKGPERANVTLWGNPILARQSQIANSFKVDGKNVTVQIKYSVSKLAIKQALDKCPWGVVVCFNNSAYGPHYITFNKCLNPDAENPNDYIFTVSDPASVDAYNAADVIFEQSYSYQKLRYRFYQATQMQIWSYDQD